MSVEIQYIILWNDLRCFFFNCQSHLWIDLSISHDQSIDTWSYMSVVVASNVMLQPGIPAPYKSYDWTISLPISFFSWPATSSGSWTSVVNAGVATLGSYPNYPGGSYLVFPIAIGAYNNFNTINIQASYSNGAETITSNTVTISLCGASYLLEHRHPWSTLLWIILAW